MVLELGPNPEVVVVVVAVVDVTPANVMTNMKSPHHCRIAARWGHLH